MFFVLLLFVFFWGKTVIKISTKEKLWLKKKGGKKKAKFYIQDNSRNKLPLLRLNSANKSKTFRTMDSGYQTTFVCDMTEQIRTKIIELCTTLFADYKRANKCQKHQVSKTEYVKKYNINII